MAEKLVFLPLALADITMFCFRAVVGSFLIWGVWDNIVDPARMADFMQFLRANGFVVPEILARISVWAQFGCGLAFILGLAARMFGLLCAVNFLVALVMVDAQGGVRSAFPSTMLILFGLHIAASGAGMLSLDKRIGTRLPTFGRVWFGAKDEAQTPQRNRSC